mmetsp:Transcript_64098/g.126795  ORF Transcript_64098/g.126795 Transcript_64098/m.126795 type:complete len:241 (+) Transcript_64098:691-1413(+)
MEKCFTPSSASFDCDCAAVFAASKNSVDKLSASSDGPAHSIVPVADVIGPSLVAKGLRLLRGEFACVAATLVAVCLAPTDRCKRRGIEADTGLWRPGDIRAAPRLFAIIREFLLGDVRPVAALAPDVVRGTSDRDEGNVARLEVIFPTVAPSASTSKAFSKRRAEFCSCRCNRAAHFLRISSMLCLARMSIGDSPCNISVVAAAAAAVAAAESLGINIASCGGVRLSKRMQPRCAGPEAC